MNGGVSYEVYTQLLIDDRALTAVDARLRVLEQGLAQSVGVTEKLSGALNRTDAALTKLATDGKAAFDGIGREVDDLHRKVDNVGAKGGLLGGMLGGVGGAGLAYGGVKQILSDVADVGGAFISLGANVESAEARITGLLMTFDGVGAAAARSGASDLFGKLRGDAARGVGDTGQYLDIFQSIYGPAAAAGASREQIRDLTRLSVAAGFQYRGNEGISLAGLDVQQALTSGAGERTTPIVNLALRAAGISLDEFNKKATPERLRDLAEAFGRLEPVVAEQADTWEAQSATLRDSITQLATEFADPTFAVFKDVIGAMNEGIGQNREELDNLAKGAGETVGALVRVGVALESVIDFGGALEDATGDVETMAAAARVFADLADQLPKGSVPIPTPNDFLRGGGASGAVGQVLGRELVDFVSAKWAERGVDRMGESPIDPMDGRLLQSDLIDVLDQVSERIAADDKKPPPKIEITVRIPPIQWGQDRELAVGLERIIREATEAGYGAGARTSRLGRLAPV